jgi:predicted dehydrogenase
MGPYFLTALSQVFGSIAGVVALASSAAPTRTIGQGPRAGVVFDVGVPTYVAAIYDFAAGSVAQATFSFDSPMIRVGVLEIAGSEASLVAPDPNKFDGDLRVIRAGKDEEEVVPAQGVVGGRGIGVVDMARALRTGGRHRASGELGLHILDAMLATAESARSRTFVAVDSAVEPVPALPESWDPLTRTV